MAYAHPTNLVSASDDIRIRTITLHDLRTALSLGWSDFLDRRGDLLFVGLIYPLVALLVGMYVRDTSVLPLIFPVVAGSVLFGPVAATGFYELARRREQGQDARWQHFLDVLRGPAAPSLLALTSVVAVLFAVWIGVAWNIYTSTLRAYALEPESVVAFARVLFSTPEGWQLIIVGNLVGLAFAVVALAITVVSFPMLVDRRVEWTVAMQTSVRVAWHNPVTIAVWGLIVVALLILGSIPAFVGLAVVLPMLGYATWHLYTLAVER